MDSTCPELDDFAGAFGRQCSLAAQALSENNSREAVRVAFQGHGDNIALVLVALRQNRTAMNMLLYKARNALVRARGIIAEDANKAIVKRALDVRNAVQSEWGKTMVDPCEIHGPGTGKACPTNKQGCVIPERWERLTLPIVGMEAEPG